MRTRARLLNENRRDGAASQQFLQQWRHAATHLRVLRSGWSPRLLFVTAPPPGPGGQANGSPLAPKNALIFNRAPIDPNRPLVPPYDGLVRETDAKTLNHVMVRGVGTR